jgi:hypothetical protein
VTEQVHTIKAERVPDSADLVDECLHDPQGGVIGVIRFPAPELVVEDDRTPGVRQVQQVFQIVVGESRSTVQDQQWQLAVRSGKITDHLVPRPVSPEPDRSLGCTSHG